MHKLASPRRLKIGLSGRLRRQASACADARKWSAKADHRLKAQSGVRARRRLALSIGTPGG